MEQKLILYPLFALVAWSFVMTVVMIKRAYRAVGEGLSVEYFRYGSGAKIPGYMRSAYQHYSNLYEMPLLFYVAVVVIYISGVAMMDLLLLCWGYVAARMVHSLLHLDNSNLPRRRDTFMLSTLVLMVLWAVTMWRVLQLP